MASGKQAGRNAGKQKRLKKAGGARMGGCGVREEKPE